MTGSRRTPPRETQSSSPLSASDSYGAGVGVDRVEGVSSVEACSPSSDEEAKEDGVDVDADVEDLGVPDTLEGPDDGVDVDPERSVGAWVEEDAFGGKAKYPNPSMTGGGAA